MRRKLLGVVLGGLLAVTGMVRADEPAGPNTGAMSFSGGIDFVTAYVFRGYMQEDQGLIAQPYLQLSLEAFDVGGVKLTPYAGIWSSVHSEHTGTDGSNDAWYEADLFGGVNAAIGDFTFGVIYTNYTYPNGAFDSIGEIGFKVSWADAQTMKKVGIPFALNPSLGVYFETDDGNGSEDAYLEIGIAPSFEVKAGDVPVTLAVPIVGGFSLDDYYPDDSGDDEFFGYLSIGLTATVGLPMPSRYGSWSLTGGVYYYRFAADSAEAANNNDDDEIVGKIGVAFTY